VAAKRPDQRAIRIYVDADTYSLLKRLAGVREQSLNNLMNGMIDDWLGLEDQQEAIERHRLDEFGDEKD
jgi:hypothetical protein